MSLNRTSVDPFVLGCVVAILAVFGIGLLILWGGATHVTKPQHIAVATGNWPPYIVENADAQGDDPAQHGPLAALVAEMFRLAGYKIELKFYTWDDALQAVENGDALAAFSYAREADFLDPKKLRRTDRFWFTSPFFHFDHALFYKRDNLRTTELLSWAESENSARRYRLGRIEGYTLWPRVINSVAELSSYPDIESAFSALDAGEIDLLPEDPHVGAAFLRARGLDGKFGRYWSPDGVMTGAALAQHVLVARTRKGLQLRNQLNAAIATLQAQGKLADFKSRFKKRDPQWKVRTPAKTLGLTTGRELCGEEVCRRYLLAPGTSAVVLLWPASLLRPVTSDAAVAAAGSEVYLVKITSGPHVNRLIYVPLNALELNP
jgi:ABC-type amino acid transport substrate-binding protein